MSALGDAFKALREVVLMQSHIERLQDDVRTLTSDLDGLGTLVALLRDRVSRIEGLIEGAAMASGRFTPPRLPE